MYKKMYHLTNKVSAKDNYLRCGLHIHLILCIRLKIYGDSSNDHYFVTKFVAVNKRSIS